MTALIRARVARRRSDGQWSVAIGGRPPAIVVPTHAEAMIIAQRSGFPVEEADGKPDDELTESQRWELQRAAAAHVRWLLDMGMHLSRIVRTARLPNHGTVYAVPDGDELLRPHVSRALLGVAFVLSDQELYAVELSHALGMGMNPAEAVEWVANGYGVPRRTVAAQMRTVNRREEAAA